MEKRILLLLIVLIFSSCEKEIDVDLNIVDPQVVIEAAITNETGPYFVRLSKTVNFSDANTYPPISNASIIISDNTGTEDVLTEVSPGLYQTNTLTGVPGRTYYLTVDAEGKNYQAESTMPELVNLDSIRFTSLSGPLGGDGYSTVPVFTDPAAPGNNYRFILTVNNETDDSYIIFNDNVNNGLVNQRPIFSPDTEIELGDIVNVEMRGLDNSAYLFFFTLSQIAGGGPGGGTTPTNPPNNIKGINVLGIFSAHTIQHATAIVKE